jgi:hypothetical protein
MTKITKGRRVNGIGGEERRKLGEQKEIGNLSWDE